MKTQRLRPSKLPSAEHWELNIALAFPLLFHSRLVFWKKMGKVQSMFVVFTSYTLSTSAQMTHNFPSSDIQWAHTLSCMHSAYIYASPVSRPYIGAMETGISRQTFSVAIDLRRGRGSTSFLNLDLR